MLKYVLTEEAKWYIAKCFNGLNESELYQKAVKNIEEMANKQFKKEGKVIVAFYDMNEESTDQVPERERRCEDIGVLRNGNTIVASPKAFILVD